MLPLTKRQREILDYLNEFIAQHGYAPSLEESPPLRPLFACHGAQAPDESSGEGLISGLEPQPFVEMIPTRTGGRAVELPSSATSPPPAD